jgi:hypothetical protein
MANNEYYKFHSLLCSEIITILFTGFIYVGYCEQILDTKIRNCERDFGHLKRYTSPLFHGGGGGMGERE